MSYLIAPERSVTPDFTLRSFHSGDGGIFSEAVNESYEHLRPFFPWAKPYQAVEASEKLVRQFRGHYMIATEFNVAFVTPDGKRMLGAGAYRLTEGPLESQNAEVFLWVRTSASGKGLGARVLVAMLRWGFSEWPWRRLSWRADIDNFAAITVAERSGMEREGVLRQFAFKPDGTRTDTVCYAALRDTWREPTL